VFNLTSVDWLIILFFFGVVLGTGFTLRSSIQSAADYLQASRSIPAWLSAIGVLAASLGAPEVLGLSAWGAQYGLHAAQFYLIGAIPALLFTGLVLMPVYYGSGARSIPDYLRLRYDGKTRTLNAVLFAAMTVVCASISLCVLARIIQGLHLFGDVFYAFGWPQGSFVLMVALSAILVLLYILFAGLTASIVNQAVQFALLTAGLLPAVFLGLKDIGGWTGLKAALPASATSTWAGHFPTSAVGTGIALGFVFGFTYWCSDFRILQGALAARSSDDARRAPLLAAIPALFIPLVVIVPGLLAVSLPTPHTTTVVHNESGVIYHEINVVPPAAAAGLGLVPARSNPVTGAVLFDASGHPRLEYDLALPNLLLHYFPTGLLGLGVAALLACFMSGIAANLTAFNAVFTGDIYRACFHRDVPDTHTTVARFASIAFLVLSAAAALVVFHTAATLNVLLLVIAFVNAPLFAVLLLGIFWPRATGHGAFAGLLAGSAVALLHHGLTLPPGVDPGLRGGWIFVLHRYPGGLAQALASVLIAFGVSLVAAAAVSLATTPRPAAELSPLLFAQPRDPAWRKAAQLATAILIAALILSFFVY